MVAVIRENHGGECSGIDGCADRNRCEEATGKQKDQRKRKKKRKASNSLGHKPMTPTAKETMLRSESNKQQKQGATLQINNIVYYDGHYKPETQKEANYGSKKPPKSNTLHRQEPAKEQNMQM